MITRLIVGMVACALAVPLGSCDPCDEDGFAYTCTCSKRCQGATTTTTSSLTCFTGDDPVQSVTASCENSCSPEATCTCSCTRGAACVVNGECH